MLTGSQIKAANLINESVSTSFRGASYDLTIGELINVNGEPVDEYVVPRQGIVKIVSKEIVTMPQNLVGYVLVKTSLCNKGILALNIGIVDPGFEGPLTSTLINFGKVSHRLRKGDTFSRLSIHKLSEEVSNKDEPKTAEQTKREAIDQVDRYLPQTFLDIARTSKEAAEEVFGAYKKTLFIWVPAFALVVALLTLFLNFGNIQYLQHILQPEDHVRSELLKAEMEKQLETLVQENKAMRTDLTKMQEDLSRMKDPANKHPTSR